MVEEDSGPATGSSSTRVVFPMASMTPRDAERANLELLTAALDDLGVDWFVVRRTGGTNPTVGVQVDPAETPAAFDARVSALLDGLLDRLVPTDAYVAASGPGMRRQPAVLASTLPRGSLGKARVVEVFRWYVHERKTLGYRFGFAAHLEVWQRTPAGHWAAPRPNAVSRVLGEGEMRRTTTSVPLGRPAPTLAAFDRLMETDIDFPIDIVIPWVDSSDLAWRARKEAAQASGPAPDPEATSPVRFRSRGEITFALRSIDMYAPWIRTVYLVTDGQVPPGIDTTRDDLRIVDHRDIVADESYLPMFNSSAIVSWLHRIDGLSEHYLVGNDDIFFGRPVDPQMFFLPSGLTKAFYGPTRRELVERAPSESLFVSMKRYQRRLLEERFGRTVTSQLRHIQNAQRRSVALEVEREFADAIERTRRATFRTREDVNLDQFHHYYAELTGRAVRGSCRYAYVNLSDEAEGKKLEALLKSREPDVFCLNDGYRYKRRQPVSGQDLRRFLRRYFPVPSRWELPRGT